MTKRVLTGLFALTLSFGAAACGGDTKVDKSAAVDNLVESGLMNQDQAQCTVDEIVAEFGDNEDVLEELDKEAPDLSDEDQTKITDIMAGCLGVGASVTTVGG